MEGFLNQLPIGFSIAAVLLLIALGLTFTFGQMGVINMAHGEFIMVGAYTAYMLHDPIGSQTILVALPVAFVVAGIMGLILERTLISGVWLPELAAFVAAGLIGLALENSLINGGWSAQLAAFVAAGLIGLILEIFLISRFHGRPRGFYGRPLDTLLLTWGVSLILQQLARDLIDTRGVQIPAPSWLVGQTNVGGISIPYNRIFIFSLAVACLVAIWFYVNRTPAGRRTRAVVQNRELAACTGVVTGRVDQLTFFVGSGLAGVAGVAITLIGSINPNIGSKYIVDAFLVVVVGGLGQLRGAVLAAIALGLLNSYVEFWTDTSLAKVIVFIAIVAILQARPQGFFQLRTRALT